MEIKFEHVDFSYQKVNCSSKTIFKDLHIVLSSGKIHGIVGKCGSGKTTLLDLINLLILPTNGKIKIGDFTIMSNKKLENVNELHSKIGFVYQEPEEQFFNSTVYDELIFNLHNHEYNATNPQKRISDALKMVGLDDSYFGRSPHNLSTGEKRRISIACALVYNPKILLLDEPTAGLDYQNKESLIKLLRMLKNRYHKTVVIASHDIDFLHRIIDDVYVLYNQKVVLSGNKYDVFKQAKELKKYGVSVPKVIEFSNLVLEKKKVKMGYRDEINDLIKDIYRFVK